MAPISLTRDLMAAGFTSNEVARQVRAGTLSPLRRGAYLRAVDVGLSPAARHLRLVEATMPLVAAGSVVSHLSAAVVHGLPVFADQLDHVQLTRDDVAGGKRRGRVHLHAAPLDPTEVVVINGITTTSMARTVVDVARSLAFDRAVVVGDAALRQTLDTTALADSVGRAAGRPGVAQARRVCGFLDPRSESPGESLSRVVLHEAGIPAPTPQYSVYGSGGRLAGRADFGWEEQRTLGEFDGRTKYGRLLKPGESTEDVLYREKLREDALRDLGWQVVRWTWADLRHPATIADRLLRAFQRSARAPSEPG
jgi:hypothetical protein